MKIKKDVQRLPGLHTCPTCNFALLALTYAPAQSAYAKALAALRKHLSLAHDYTHAEIEIAVIAAEKAAK